MVGNDKLNISTDKNLTRLLDSFHRDRPKGRWGVPSWNLSLVLHQLTKAPFEPLRKASLKHLTFKTVFLLALGSGKRRSEIHAWLYKNIRHQENWSQVSLYPSPSFLSKNQLAQDGLASIALVVIPALAPTLDKSFSEDIGPSVRYGHYDITWTRPKISDEEKTWCLFLSGRVFLRTLSLLQSLPGLNRQYCCVISSQTKRPKIYIKLELMMFGPLQLLRPFRVESLWSRFSQPVTGKPTIPSPSSVWRIWLGQIPSCIIWAPWWQPNKFKGANNLIFQLLVVHIV